MENLQPVENKRMRKVMKIYYAVKRTIIVKK